MLGKIEGQKEKGATENEMVRENHQLNGYDFVQTPGDSEGQGSLVCCSPWGHKESDMTYWLSNKNTTSTSLTWLLYLYSIMDWIFVSPQNVYVEILILMGWYLKMRL